MKLEHEVEKNKILSTALQTLATEHHELELSVAKGPSRRSALSEDEFHDAVSGECGGGAEEAGDAGRRDRDRFSVVRPVGLGSIRRKEKSRRVT